MNKPVVDDIRELLERVAKSSVATHCDIPAIRELLAALPSILIRLQDEQFEAITHRARCVCGLDIPLLMGIYICPCGLRHEALKLDTFAVLRRFRELEERIMKLESVIKVPA